MFIYLLSIPLCGGGLSGIPTCHLKKIMKDKRKGTKTKTSNQEKKNTTVKEKIKV